MRPEVTMQVDFSTLGGLAAYQWLTRLIVPRPIGWISTVDLQGRPNLAPFSWFQSVASSPPLLLIAAGYRRNAEGETVSKDTVQNAVATGELVIQLVEQDQAEAMVKTSAELPKGQSEFDFAGLECSQSEMVSPPRVVGARVAFECRVEEVIAREHWKTELLLARVLCAQVDDSLLGADGFPDAELWRPIARLGGDNYAAIGELFRLERG